MEVLLWKVVSIIMVSMSDTILGQVLVQDFLPSPEGGVSKYNCIFLRKQT